jgi:uncharacterized protein YjbI with pentapeptide repeats
MLKPWATWLRSTWWLAGTVAAVLLVVLVWALFVPVPDWLAHHDVGSVTGPLHETALDNARGRLLTLSAGLVALVALIFTARTFHLSREGQVTDRYTKAVEQLGSDKLDVRIGGIYALERIARDSAKDHPAVMEVLTAFIREHARERWAPTGPDDPERERSPRPDVQAAVTVVGRRDAQRDFRAVNLSGADLSGSDLHWADLSRGNLRGAQLEGANLEGAHLEGAHLEGAHLTGANLVFADLTAAELHSADLRDARLIRAHLDRVNLGDANLTGADLTYAELRRAHLSGADLTRAVLADTDLTDARLAEAILIRAILPRANLARANLAEANLVGAMLPQADLTGADLARANLVGATLADADLTDSDLTDADLARAILPHAKLVRARLSNVDLTGADLVGADLAEAKGLLTADLTEATLSGVRWPGGTPVPEGWWLDEKSSLRPGPDPGPTEAV